MDINKVKETILSQFNGASGLYSLQIQNHIYGCFLIMEDIAQQTVTVSEYTLIYPDKEFRLDEAFADIGLQYGFIMDEKLRLDGFNSEYKDMWLDCFKTADLTHDISMVDTIEDTVIDLINTIVPESEAFFTNALETGCLTDEWVQKVLLLLTPPDVHNGDLKDTTQGLKKAEDVKEPEDVKPTEEHKAQIEAASHEKVIKSHHKSRGVHLTRRGKGRRSTPKKKVLVLTRRNKRQ